MGKIDGILLELLCYWFLKYNAPIFSGRRKYLKLKNQIVHLTESYLFEGYHITIYTQWMKFILNYKNISKQQCKKTFWILSRGDFKQQTLAWLKMLKSQVNAFIISFKNVVKNRKCVTLSVILWWTDPRAWYRHWIVGSSNLQSILIWFDSILFFLSVLFFINSLNIYWNFNEIFTKC